MKQVTFLALVALTVVAGCNRGAATTIPLSWKNPGFDGTTFKKLLVIGVGRDDAARRLFEDTFARAIATEGAAAQASWGLLPQSEKLSEAQIRGALDSSDYDGVLITHLLSIDKDQEYVPPSMYTVPTGYYGYGYYGYYGARYEVVHQPGYYKTNTTFRVETNLYSAATGQLVWSGRSNTVNPASLTDVIDSMTAAVAKKLKQEKLIP